MKMLDVIEKVTKKVGLVDEKLQVHLEVILFEHEHGECVRDSKFYDSLDDFVTSLFDFDVHGWDVDGMRISKFDGVIPGFWGGVYVALSRGRCVQRFYQKWYSRIWLAHGASALKERANT